MAYKFQVGPAIFSGSAVYQDALETKSSFAATSVSASAALSGGSLDIGGSADIDGNLDVGGEFKMADNTAGKILVADGNDYAPVVMSGDVAIASGGATTIQAGAVEGSMLNANVPGLGLHLSGSKLHLSASVAGAGLDYAAGVLKVNIDEFAALGGTGIDQADKLLFSDAGVEKTITFSNLQDAVFADVSGDATVAAGGALTIADNAVGLSKLAGIARGSIILGDSSGDPSLLAKGTAAQFLQSDGTDPSYVSISGDATVAAGGALTIGAGKVTNSMLSGGIANAKLVNDAVTLTPGAGLGTLGSVALGASITVAVDGVLEDLDTLGVASADGEFIVATGAGAFAYESGNTARTSLGLGTGDDATLTRVSASVGFATPGLIQAGTVQATTYNGDSVAVTGITGSLNNKLAHGEGITPFSFNNSASTQISLSASVAGAGLAYSTGVLSLDIDELSALGGASLHQTQDKFLISDNGAEKTVSFSNLEDSIFANVSGDATVAAGGALTIAAGAVEHGMLNDDIINGQDALTAPGDSDLMMIDDGAVKKITLADLQTYFAGGAPTGRGDADVTLSEGVNFGSALITQNRTWTLPASPADGDKVIVKAARVDPGVYITVAVDGGGSHVIDSGDPVRLQEDFAAVTLVYVGSNQWMLI